MWPPLPAPTMPAVALSRLALSQAISSLRFFAGSAFLVTIQSGVSATIATGSKSRQQVVLQRIDRADATWVAQLPMPIV